MRSQITKYELSNINDISIVRQFKRMGICANEKKKKKIKTNTIKNSKFEIASSNSTIFSLKTCPIENIVIIDTFNKLKLDHSPFSLEWKLLQTQQDSSKGQKLYGICEWPSKNSSIMHGLGALYNQTKLTQFLLAGKFKKGSIIRGDNYYKIFANGSYYIGQIDENYDAEGLGEINLPAKQERYKGNFRKGIPDGEGQQWTPNKIFKGTFLWGEKNKGVQISELGQYEGQFSNNMRDGKGTLKLKNGIKYEGQFKMNRRHGYGILYSSSGQKQYEGQWDNDKKVQR